MAASVFLIEKTSFIITISTERKNICTCQRSNAKLSCNFFLSKKRVYFPSNTSSDYCQKIVVICSSCCQRSFVQKNDTVFCLFVLFFHFFLKQIGIMELSNTIMTETLPFDNNSLYDSTNTPILNSTIDYAIPTKRFHCPIVSCFSLLFEIRFFI